MEGGKGGKRGGREGGVVRRKYGTNGRREEEVE